MPRIFRLMRNENGKPAVGSSASTLGVRTASGPALPPADIAADENGNVAPSTGGMSVAPNLQALLRLPARMIPQRLRALAPKAAGNNTVFAWAMGAGPFVAAPVAENLALRPDPKNNAHGFVEPATIMSLPVYNAAIAATREQWHIDEGIAP